MKRPRPRRQFGGPGHEIVAAVPVRLEPGEGLVVVLEVAPEGGSDALHREVVVGRPEPARDDDGVVLGAMLVDDASDVAHSIRNRRDALDVDATIVELLAEPRSVRIRRSSSKQFVSDRHDRDIHTGAFAPVVQMHLAHLLFRILSYRYDFR